MAQTARVARRKHAERIPGPSPSGLGRLEHEGPAKDATAPGGGDLGRLTHATQSGDPAIARLAAAQRGVVTLAQLRACGLGRGAIRHRVAQRRLHRLHRGAYLVGHPLPPPLAREAAAVLACGRGAVLSHLSAASLWGVHPAVGGPVDVTTAARSRRGGRGLRVHRVRGLDPRDVRRRFGIPLTAPARRVLDLAEVVNPDALRRALEGGQLRGLMHRAELCALLDRSPGRRGAAALAGALDADAGLAPTRSEAEERLLALLRAAELPPTAVNARIGRHEVDLLFEPERLVVEMDGFAYHRTRSAFERDRLRDAELQAAGYRVVRVTWRQLVERPEALVARLAQALARA
jgi:very-short-patch-repair endonuclease